MVGGQLHNEGSGITGEHLGLLQDDTGDDDGRHTDEVSGGGDPCAAAEQGAGDHADEGNLCAAGDEGGGHDGHTAVTFILDGTGRHNAGDTAAGTDQHGDEGLTGQAELAENTIQHEGDTGHVAAGLQEGQHQEQHQHLGHEAQHRADTGDDTVKDQAAEPLGGAGCFQTAADQCRDAGDPDAEVGGIGRVKAVLGEIVDRVDVGHLDDVVHLVRALGQRVIVGGHRVHGEGLLVLNIDGRGLAGGLEVLHLGQQGVCVKVVGLRVDFGAEERIHGLDGGGILIVRVVIGARADTEQVPAIAEHTVVGPVGSGCAHAYHSDPVDQEHNDGKDGQPQPAVGDDAVDLIRGRQRTLVLLLIAALDDLGDVDIALVGDDALGVVVQLLLGGLDIGLDVGHGLGGDAQLGQHLVVALKDLDGVPALLLLGHAVDSSLLDVGDGVLHGAGEGVHGNGLGALGGGDGSLGGLHNAGALQGGDLHDLAAQLAGQLGHVDLVAVLLDDIHHVDGDDNGDTQLGQLRGQVQVTLQVRTIDDVQDGVGTLVDQVVTGHHFLQRVGGQGVNTGQVHDGHVVVLLQLAFLLLHRNAGPVAHELVRAGQRIEQRGFTGVRVARKGNFNLLFHIRSFRIADANRHTKFFTRPRSFRYRPCAETAHSRAP